MVCCILALNTILVLNSTMILLSQCPKYQEYRHESSYHLLTGRHLLTYSLILAHQYVFLQSKKNPFLLNPQLMLGFLVHLLQFFQVQFCSKSRYQKSQFPCSFEFGFMLLQSFDFRVVILLSYIFLLFWFLRRGLL